MFGGIFSTYTPSCLALTCNPRIFAEKREPLGQDRRRKKHKKQGNRRTTKTMGRPSKGRQRIEIRRIEKGNRLSVTFSKRKSSLQRKASELSLLCGAQVALIIFSPGGRAFALGTPSVDHVLRRFTPLPDKEDDVDLPAALQDGDAVNAIADRAEVEAIVRQTEDTKAIEAAEKVRMGKIGDKVRQVVAVAGRKFWWEADVDALGEAELPEFARALRCLRDNVQRRVDSLLASA